MRVSNLINTSWAAASWPISILDVRSVVGREFEKNWRCNDGKCCQSAVPDVSFDRYRTELCDYRELLSMQ